MSPLTTIGSAVTTNAGTAPASAVVMSASADSDSNVTPDGSDTSVRIAMTPKTTRTPSVTGSPQWGDGAIAT